MGAGDDARQQGAGHEAAVPPQPVDGDRPGPPGGGGATSPTAACRVWYTIAGPATRATESTPAADHDRPGLGLTKIVSDY
jgi:hypothetical protein